MPQNSGCGPDFNLPDEILSVIPTDPYDQLDLSRKITSMAIASRVSKLEGEVSELRQKMVEKDRVVYELQDKLSYLERAYHEADSSLRIAVDENMKLIKERDSLAITAKKLSRDFAKLEAFKKQLMQSLNDSSPSQIKTDDVGTCDQSVPRAYPDEETNCYSSNHTPINEVLRQPVRKFSLTPYLSPRLTPTGTPKINSGTGSPISSSSASSPNITSGVTSPAKPHYDLRSSVPSWFSSSQQSSAANSPPWGHLARTPRIDGKEFFRQARNRLSYEQFSAFLANVKEFNAHKQTREETLRRAEEIFETDNKDLYVSFQGLLNRKVH